jgi:hypothetical protein
MTSRAKLYISLFQTPRVKFLNSFPLRSVHFTLSIFQLKESLGQFTLPTAIMTKVLLTGKFTMR